MLFYVNMKFKLYIDFKNLTTQIILYNACCKYWTAAGKKKLPLTLILSTKSSKPKCNNIYSK